MSMRRPRVIVLLASALASAGALASFVIVGRGSRASSVEEAGEAPVAIVLGAGVTPEGWLSAVLEDRLLAAVELYRRGKVAKLLLSGDHGRATYDEPSAMALFVEREGVPADDVFLDHAGFDTYATLYRARHVFGVKRALVVTQDFHLPRALFLARRLGIDAEGVRCDRRPYRRSAWYSVREVGARMKALAAVELGLKPRFLGPDIPIEGDGRATR